jgi:electron transport complex protein RnfE
LIIATFVTIVRLALDKFLPPIYESLGLYLPLIVVNCIILGRAESFASKNKVGWSILDGLFMGIGFTLALTLMGAVREFLGYGTLFNIQIMNFQIGFFSSSAGAFFTYAVFIAVFSLVSSLISNKRKKKALLKAQAESQENTKEVE